MKRVIDLSLNVIPLLTFFFLLSCSDKITPQNHLIRIKGSDSELSLVTYFASVCTENNPDANFIVEGGGSRTGIEALINKEADVANASREMTNAEYILAKQKGIRVYPVIFAIDAVAFITHSETGIDSLSLDQLHKMYAGEITNWKEVGGNDLPISLYGRNNQSGTYSYVLDKLRLTEFSSNTTELKDNKFIYETVRAKKGALGYVSLHTIMQRNGKPVPDVWAISIYVDSLRAVSPYQVERVMSGEYILNRPLYQYFNGRPTGTLKDLVETELSPSGQALLRQFGYFPLTEYQIGINREINKITE